MLSKPFEKFLITLFCINAAIWAYHFLAGTHWTYWDHLKDPVNCGELYFMAIFVVGALYRSADAIVTAIKERAP
jgi:hypothetical protein